MHSHHIFGFILFILDIWAWINIFQSNKSVFVKILWALFVLIIPIIGLVIWFFAGPKKVKQV